ncbi:hypothetical protein Tsubulata_035899, partial [Turnera subulata]
TLNHSPLHLFSSQNPNFKQNHSKSSLLSGKAPPSSAPPSINASRLAPSLSLYSPRNQRSSFWRNCIGKSEELESRNDGDIAASVSSFREEKEVKEIEVTKEGLENQGIWKQMKEIVMFTGPATGLWLCGPLMSLIDTADKNEVQHQISILLFVGLVCGISMLLFTRFLGSWALTAFTGAQNAQIIPAANVYVQIRGLAWPAILVGWVAQSASLGMKDSWGPLKALAVSSLVNGVGDLFRLWDCWCCMGYNGVTAYMMIEALNKKGYNALAISIPTSDELLTILGLAAPVFVTMMSKVAFYSLLIYFATSMGTHSVAAHQMQKVLLPYFIALAVTPSTHSLEGTLMLLSSRGFGLPACWFALAGFQWTRFSISLRRLLSPDGILYSEDPSPHKMENIMQKSGEVTVNSEHLIKLEKLQTLLHTYHCPLRRNNNPKFLSQSVTLLSKPPISLTSPGFHTRLLHLKLPSTKSRSRLLTASVSSREELVSDRTSENDSSVSSVSSLEEEKQEDGEQTKVEASIEGLGNQSIWQQMREIVVFTGPAAGLWICGPLMSLIDTAVIGQGSSLELAALDSWGPLKALAVASAVNGIGDIVLCRVLSYGIAGAAWATMASQARTLLKSLVIIGTILGLVLGIVGTSVPWLFPNMFTPDRKVIQEMHKVLVPYFIALAVTPPLFSLEGTLLAGRDLRFVSLMTIGCFSIGALALLVRFLLSLQRLLSPDGVLFAEDLSQHEMKELRTT